MVAERISDVVARNGEGVPSLVDVLCKLAAHWCRCVCIKETRQSRLESWEKEGLRLGRQIDSLNCRIPDIEAPSKKTAMLADLAILEAQSKALNEEWGLAYNEVGACEEMFLEAREFCKKTCNIGDDELFNAALVRFRSKLLQPGQEPSKRRMLKIKSLLKNVHADE